MNYNFFKSNPDYMDALREIYEVLKSHGIAEAYVRGSSLRGRASPMDVDVVVVAPKQLYNAIKVVEKDGGRRFTRVVGYEFVEQLDSQIRNDCERHGIEMVYSRQTPYGMQKHGGTPMEITIIPDGKWPRSGKIAREREGGLLMPLERFLDEANK